jgi:hypothetical protein
MIVGTNTVPDYVEQFGFVVSTNLKILGFDITKIATDLEQNISKATEKIKNIIHFWNRFRLSLEGRINVAKTLLISQLNYFVSIIPVPEYILEEISTVINNFIKGSLKISRESIALEVDRGGIGFLDLKNFISSLQCSWAKKASNNTIDNWQLEVQKKTQGNIEILTPEMFNKKINPVLHAISKSFSDFKCDFYLQNNNFLQSTLLGNPLFKPSIVEIAGPPFELEPVPVPVLPDPEPIVIWSFWASNGMVNVTQLSRLKTGDLLEDNGVIKPDQVLLQILNIPVDRLAILKQTLANSLRYVKKNNYQTRANTDSLNTFITRIKKGSKNFRKVFNNKANAKVKCSRNNKTKTFFRLIELPIPMETELYKLNSEWSTCVYPVKLREFIFKFHPNVLGLNTCVSHFNRNVNRSCTFCTINGLGNRINNNNIQIPVRGAQVGVGGGPAGVPIPVAVPVPAMVPIPPPLAQPVPVPDPAVVPDETFIHLFYECPHTSGPINNFFRVFLNDMRLDNNMKEKKILFLGNNVATDMRDNLFISTLAITVMFYIWECKLQKRLPSNEGLANDVFYLIENIRRASAMIRHDMSINLHICRSWTPEAARRR